MSRTAPKGIVTLRMTCALLLAALLVTGQAMHAAAGITHGLCHPQASGSKSGHHCAGQRHTGQSKHCCCQDPACNCDLSQGAAEPGGLFAVSVANPILSDPIHAGALNQSVAGIPDAGEKIPGTGWAQARAPSETLFPDTTKLIC